MEALEIDDESLSDYEYDTFLDQLEFDSNLDQECIYCLGCGCSDCLL